jgi:small subunit ribosomal protein S19
MTRSLYKPDFISQDIHRKIKNQTNLQGMVFQTRNRNTTITKDMIGCFFKVYNGKIFSKVTVANPDMIGHKLGEFVFTKRMGSFLHKRAAAERLRKKKQKVLAQQQSRKKSKTKTKKK